MEILDLVLTRLKTDVETPEMTNEIARVESFIKEYCCILEIPTSLFDLWADMVYDLLSWEGTGEGDSFTGLSSISMGDVSYGFSGDSLNGAEIAKSLFNDYKHRLNMARKGMFR